ncbi:MAG: ABC transporter ATP-binding protein [Desulfovibrio sp.]|nr:ABC transporter ATP-binding protein [Desulfovibrio sp.]
MNAEPVITIEGVSKRFKRFRRRRDRFLELIRHRQLHTDFIALEPLSLTVRKGTILGIIGENGSGKSTLLKLMSGILLPDSGSICRFGKVTGLLELGTGFNMELSGRKNIYFNGTYLGMSRQQLAEREDAIITFAELEDCIDAPLKSYSSGMVMRLAFAIAIHADPDCFLIDEALSVGDVRFQQKCFARIRAFRQAGGSIVFVSHDMNAVKLLCDQAMLLHKGELRYLGSPDEAVNLYNEAIAPADSKGHTISGYGNGAVSFTAVETLDSIGNPVTVLTSGQSMDIRFRYTCRAPTNDVTFGITIRDRFGQDVFGSNGALLGVVADIREEGWGCFHFPAMNIAPGLYTVNLAAHTGTTHLENCFHWWDKATAFEVVQDPDYYFGGHTRLDVTLELGKGHHGEL